MAETQFTLDRAVVFEWRALGMAVRVTRRDVEIIEDLTSGHQLLGNRSGQVAQQA